MTRHLFSNLIGAGSPALTGVRILSTSLSPKLRTKCVFPSTYPLFLANPLPEPLIGRRPWGRTCELCWVHISCNQRPPITFQRRWVLEVPRLHLLNGLVGIRPPRSTLARWKLVWLTFSVKYSSLTGHITVHSKAEKGSIQSTAYSWEPHLKSSLGLD